jgi:hypothetical protein
VPDWLDRSTKKILTKESTRCRETRKKFDTVCSTTSRIE